MSLGPVEIGLILLMVMLLFGYRKLPDAASSLGRSLRIFTSEVDDVRSGSTTATDAADVRGSRRATSGAEGGSRPAPGDARPPGP
jgi:sec-independent protein translocase protein TatA